MNMFEWAALSNQDRQAKMSTLTLTETEAAIINFTQAFCLFVLNSQINPTMPIAGIRGEDFLDALGLLYMRLTQLQGSIGNN